jgi:hypothetical protein
MISSGVVQRKNTFFEKYRQEASAGTKWVAHLPKSSQYTI